MSCRWRFDPGRSAALTAPLSFGGAARQARSATRASTVGPGAFAGPGVVLSRRSSGSNGRTSRHVRVSGVPRPGRRGGPARLL
ncbi:hypothetical protein M8J77_015372 [Diaphorina citri]|nr:hypothetical protein M8J77_016379 [Diaphorina citri]KAI5697967.1 hypothetical protein M8J77_021165 [Diaphorina citri]KAI5700298.1 hypothetical protein M8J77_011040 [Diaphorina citri]KAI5702249.1 hypothetical protein M8J77_015372 [Diaphorina citri]